MLNIRLFAGPEKNLNPSLLFDTIIRLIDMDFEWKRDVYKRQLKRGMNEIIEIGAVKLDENLKVIDTFKQLIKPKLSKKLG